SSAFMPIYACYIVAIATRCIIMSISLCTTSFMRDVMKSYTLPTPTPIPNPRSEAIPLPHS
ncbi:hypothetical protein, partial [Bartonella sp. CL50QHWL]|uniref:hypothetical protein n=1 Tax=Bartonella sp. CL50QHWL TaxID=3243536 RepID=UPI0035CF1709